MWENFDNEFIQQSLAYSSELRTDPEERKKRDADKALKEFVEKNEWTLDFDAARAAFVSGNNEVTYE